MLNTVGVEDKTIAIVVVPTVAAGHEGERVASARFVNSGINAGAAGVVASAVEFGGFIENVSCGNLVSGSFAVHGDGEGVADIKGFYAGKAKGGVPVKEASAVAGVAHDAIASVDSGAGNWGWVIDMEKIGNICVRAGIRIARRIGYGDVRGVGRGDFRVESVRTEGFSLLKGGDKAGGVANFVR